jgi:hypothetical protein
MAVEKKPVKPVAVAEIVLSKAQRSRIAKDLGLERDELDAVPEKLEILRFDEKSIGRRNPAAFAAERLKFGKIPGGILIPV